MQPCRRRRRDNDKDADEDGEGGDCTSVRSSVDDAADLKDGARTVGNKL